MINVIIKRDSAKPILICINPFAKVSELKARILNVQQTELAQSFKLFITHNGCKKELNDNDRLTDYGVVNKQTTLLLVPAFDGAKFIQFKLFNAAKSDREIHSTATKEISQFDITQPIDKIIEKYLRETDLNPLFYSGYCRFKSVVITFNETQKPLKLVSRHNSRLQASKTFDGNDIFSHGLIPSDTLSQLIAEYTTDLNEIFCDRYYFGCRHDRVMIKSVINIEITLPDISFLLHDKYYYINGEFYQKYDKQNDKMNLQFVPLLKNALKAKEKVLVFGYIRDRFSLNYHIIPVDIINLIDFFYPQLHGGRYEVSEYNKGLSNKLEQKTKTFIISGIEFYLRYDSKLYLVLNCKQETNISDVTFLCQLYCKSTKQKVSFIKNTNFGDKKGQTITLNDFGYRSTLECMICDIQILNMLTFNNLYEYPLELEQNAYLLEWIIDEKLTNVLKQCFSTGSSCRQTFESEIFYNMFLLRCSSTGKGEFLFSIQLIALPTNVSPLKTKCEIFAIETNHHVPKFDVSFDYTPDHSHICYNLLKMAEHIKQMDQLTFRVQIEIIQKEKH